MTSMFNQSKSKYNPASIWTRPVGNCCPPPEFRDNFCCMQTSMHNQFPGNYGILGNGSTFGNTYVLAFPEQRTPAQIGAQANPR